MKTDSRQIHYRPFVFWAGMLAFVTFLVCWQGKSGMRLSSLPGVFLSLGMLCWMARTLAPSRHWLRTLLYVMALILFAVSLAVSAGFIFSR
jgi:hypothetical protein